MLGNLLKIILRKLVIIEINSSAPPGMVWATQKQPKAISATVEVGKSKGYTLVCFVRDGLMIKIELDDAFIKTPELLFIKNWLP